MQPSQYTDVEDWAREIRPAFKTRLPSLSAAAPDYVLGQEDAVSEWNGDFLRSVNFFTRIATYEEFRGRDKVFLFGRRGTGKTSLIRMLDHEISQGQLDIYATSWVCDSQPILLSISAQLRSSPLATLPLAELAESAALIWKWFIALSAMLAHLQESSDNANEPSALKELRQFVMQCLGAFDEGSPRSILQNALETRLAEATSSSASVWPVGEQRARMRALFGGNDFLRALQVLIGVSRKHPVLVMLDAGDVYTARDHVNSAATTGLIAALTFFHDELRATGIYAKAAFPSEVLPYVFPYNKGKMQGKIVIIAWTFRDLVSLIAKRYAYALNERDGAAFLRFEEHQHALTFLYQHLPSTVVTSSGLPFDTIAYVIRHTQKTPRQVILLLNSMLTFSRRRGFTLDNLVAHPEVIVEGVHARLDQLVVDAIDMYQFLFGDVALLIKRILSDEQSHFPENRLQQRLKRVSDLRAEYQMSRGEVIQVLLSVGVLGIAHRAHRLAEPQWLLEGLFEYQFKEQLVTTPDSWLVVHPMFYGWLRTRVDANTFTYPVGLESDEQLAMVGVVPTLEARS